MLGPSGAATTGGANSVSDKQSSASTASHNFNINDAKIIEEEIAEEINKLSSQVIGSGSKLSDKKRLEIADDDLDGYSDDGFDNPADRMAVDDEENNIVDEVAEADDL